MPDPIASVVVPTCRRPDLLERCLDALNRLDHGDYEVIVVDNTAGDERTRAVTEAAGARLVLEPRAGVSRARNAGAAEARGEVIAFTDDDTVVDRAWLRLHQQALADDPELAATAGRVLPWPAELRDEWDYHDENLGENGFRIERSQDDWVERTNFGGFGIGPNMALRRHLFRRGWGFHPALGAARGLPGEEHYAWYQLVSAGWSLAYLPGAVVHHQAPPTPAAVAARRRSILRGSVAYALMLFIHEPETRRHVRRVGWTAARRQRRAWRAWRVQPGPGRMALASASLHAPAQYLVWRWRFRGVRAPAAPVC